ncbi:sensor histidine kinase [Pseudobutyrivibrio ruminis]|uniref:sensor histidine kinase n=1 Tax=Pseudobutyrivibrio ruminis TaxID=46206 RepID=UPI00042866EC|nr:ATP-binding protein [Pseudobutyrivibrio ruminis]
MRKRIQLSMLTIAIITIIAMTFDVETLYLLINKRRMNEDSWLELVVFVVVSMGIIVFCIIAARVVSDKIIGPVRNMADHVDDSTYTPEYEELVPIMDKIRSQHIDVLAAAKARQDFSASVSHELKTPLTAISGYAELLESGTVKPEESAHFIKEIRNNSDRLLRLIDDIISLSKLDGNANLTFESLDLYQLVAECMNTLSIIADKSKIHLTMEGDSCSVFGNKECLKEVVYNLVQNAIKYNNPGGNVWVKVYVDTSPTISVKDDGIGIPAADQDKIFERFYRVDKSRSKETGGTGLGLSIVKHIVELHHAKLILDSELGVGTEIKVVF